MTKELKIEGMSCGHCVMAVKKALSRLNIEKSDVRVGKAIVEYDEKKIDLNQITSTINESGYQVIEVE